MKKEFIFNKNFKKYLLQFCAFAGFLLPAFCHFRDWKKCQCLSFCHRDNLMHTHPVHFSVSSGFHSSLPSCPPQVKQWPCTKCVWGGCVHRSTCWSQALIFPQKLFLMLFERPDSPALTEHVILCAQRMEFKIQDQQNIY